MTEEQFVHRLPAEVATRLSQLGLDEALLRRAVEAGAIEARKATLNDPKTARGFYLWAKMARELREELTLRGWQRRDDGNWPTVVHPDGTHAIAVSRGNEDTGTERPPLSGREKGPLTQRAVRLNRRQGQFADVSPEFPRTDPPELPDITWLLLYYEDEPANETRAELSLPIRVEDDYIVDWRERIILAPIGGPESLSASGPDGADDDASIDVRVERR